MSRSTAVVADGVRAAAARPKLTGRAAILVLVLAVLVISFASSLRAYKQQREHLDQLRADIAQREQAIDDLEHQKQRWQDPAYLEQQARLNGFVMPGETSYVVLGPDGTPLQAQSELSDPGSVGAVPKAAWWSTAWDSMEIAGDPPKQTQQDPAGRIDGSQPDQ